jgi:hypothetical protein
MAQASGLLQDGLTGLSLLQFFSMHCSQGLLTSGGVNVQQIADEVAKLGAERSVAAGQRLFSFDERPDSFFLILKVRLLGYRHCAEHAAGSCQLAMDACRLCAFLSPLLPLVSRLLPRAPVCAGRAW